MKILRFAVPLVVSAVLFATALLMPGADRVATAQPAPEASAPARPLVFVPGLLGSMLCRHEADGTEAIVWGSLDAIAEFPRLALEGEEDELAPCGLIRQVSFLGIFTQDVYGPFIERLEAAGYREGETLFVFAYDWRRSVFDNAERLAAFIEETIPGGGKFDIIGHSMGGLVARTYALAHGGAARIGRLISAGTPWRGSVQVFELLRDGWGLGNPLIGGIEEFRRTVLSFPSTFELMPDYDGCCADEPAFDARSADAWAALNWAGIEPGALPDLAEAAARQAELRRIVAQPLPAEIEEALVIGVDQRTPQHYALIAGEGEAELEVKTSWEGDGTVMRESALLAARPTYRTSFATHDAILSDPLVQDFVIAALAQSPAAAIAQVPVRERMDILTALGDLVELVGVAIATDQPAYRTGATAKLIVHLRLGTQAPVDAGVITMTAARPGGAAVPVALAPDPAASDPSNPFEQSFSGEIETGDVAGALTVTVTLDTPAGPRVVTRVVPVI